MLNEAELTPKEKVYKMLKLIHDSMDDVNAQYGTYDRLCQYCGANTYDAKKRNFLLIRYFPLLLLKWKQVLTEKKKCDIINTEVENE